jgi:hypothetical protein
MERKASDYRRGRPGIDGLTPTEEPVAHEPMEKEPVHGKDAAIEGQSPARMTSPKSDEKEKQAIDALVAEGVARERAEELVAAHGAEGARSALQTSQDTPDSARKASHDTPDLADEKKR